jgi:hypothetical protein
MAGYCHFEKIVSSPCYTLSCRCWANMGDVIYRHLRAKVFRTQSDVEFSCTVCFFCLYWDSMAALYNGMLLLSKQVLSDFRDRDTINTYHTKTNLTQMSNKHIHTHFYCVTIFTVCSRSTAVLYSGMGRTHIQSVTYSIQTEKKEL